MLFEANAKNLQSSYNMPQIRRGTNGIPILGTYILSLKFLLCIGYL